LAKDAVFSPILFNLHSEYLTKETPEKFGDFKMGGQVIHTVKTADGLMLLAKEKTVLQGMTNRLTETGRCYEVKMNVKKPTVMNFKATIPITDYDRSKATGECEIFQLFG
jgi:hypothetical protein